MVIGWVVTGGILIWYYYDNVRFCPELTIFKRARKYNLPVLNLRSYSGFFKRVLGEKEKKGSIIFKFDKKSHEGIRIDPSIQSGAVPKSYTTGSLIEYDYGTSSAFGVDARNAVAMDTIISHVRENYPELSFLDGQTIIEYVGRSRNELPHDCRNLATSHDINILPEQDALNELRQRISDEVTESLQADGAELSDKEFTKVVTEQFEQAQKGFVLDYRANWLANKFIKIQNEVAEVPLPTGTFFAFANAFQLISTAFTSFDFQTIMQLFEAKAKLESQDNLKWVIAIAFAVMLVLVGAGLAWKFADVR